MLIETASTSILVSILRNRSLKNLKNIHIHAWYFLLIAGILQIILKMGFAHNFFYPIVFISYLLLLLCLALNFKNLSAVFIGTFLNFEVIAVNNGLMPVSVKGLEFAGYDITTISGARLDTFHCIITDYTHFSLLADIIPVPEPYPFPQMLSIGDLFIMVGVFLFIQRAMGSKQKIRMKN